MPFHRQDIALHFRERMVGVAASSTWEGRSKLSIHRLGFRPLVFQYLVTIAMSVQARFRLSKTSVMDYGIEAKQRCGGRTSGGHVRGSHDPRSFTAFMFQLSKRAYQDPMEAAL